MTADAQDTSRLSRPQRKLNIRLREALGGEAPLRQSSVGYQAATVLAASVMLLLPLVYLAMIGGVVWLLCIHLAYTATLFRDVRDIRGALIVFIAPLVAGGTLLAFMIKPIFAARQKSVPPVTLQPHEEPLLFECVANLCDHLGAPRPVAIRVNSIVNASASLEGGIFRRDLVLTIGMPLVGGLSLRQFIGVLAHEFGHFSQGSGMRATYIVRSTVVWFARVVYGRDSWDDALANASQGGYWPIMLTIWVARGAVWLVRKILTGLMYIGLLFSAILMRQMEFDADRCEGHVAGADAFEKTAHELPLLNIALSHSHDVMANQWRTKRLGDDLVALVLHSRSQITPEFAQKIAEVTAAGKTRLLDSHPCDRERIATIREENEPGLEGLDGEARDLFLQYSGLCRLVSMETYHTILGDAFDPKPLIPTDKIVDDRKKEKSASDTLTKLFGPALMAARPIFVSAAHATKPADDLLQSILDARHRTAILLDASRTQLERYAKSFSAAVSAHQVRRLQGASVNKIKAADFNLPAVDSTTTAAALAEYSAARAQVEAIFEKLERLTSERFGAALAIQVGAAPPPKNPSGPLGDADDYGEYDLLEEVPGTSFLDAMSALRGAWPAVADLIRDNAALGAILGSLQPGQKANEHLVESVFALARDCCGAHRKLMAATKGISFPFEHGQGKVSLSGFMLPAPPAERDVVAVYQASEELIGRFFDVHGRLLRQLVQQALTIESELGLPEMDASAQA